MRRARGELGRTPLARRLVARAAASAAAADGRRTIGLEGAELAQAGVGRCTASTEVAQEITAKHEEPEAERDEQHGAAQDAEPHKEALAQERGGERQADGS